MSDLIIIIIIIVNCIHLSIQVHMSWWRDMGIKINNTISLLSSSLKASPYYLCQPEMLQELLLDLSTNLPDMDLPLVSKASVQGLNFLLQLLHD